MAGKIKTEAKARGYVENLNGHGGIFDGCPASQGYGEIERAWSICRFKA